MMIAGQDAGKVARGALRSWTVWFAISLALFGALQLELDHFQTLIPPKAYGWLNIFLGVSIAVLRVVTTLPLCEKVPQDGV